MSCYAAIIIGEPINLHPKNGMVLINDLCMVMDEPGGYSTGTELEHFRLACFEIYSQYPTVGSPTYMPSIEY